MIKSQKVIAEIKELYFNKMYNYSELIYHFKNKYTYAEIKQVIINTYKEQKNA